MVTRVEKDSDRRSFIKKLIKIYEVINPMEAAKLIDSERDFLAECILLEVNGIDMGCTAARKHLEETFNLKKRSVYTLRQNVKDKGWLRQDDYGYHYPFGLDKTKFRLDMIFEDDTSG